VTRPRQPAPPPLEGNDQLIAAVITAGWAIALVVLLAVRTDLPPSSRWWVWTCVAGVAVGLFGLAYVPVLKRSRAAAAQRRRAARQAG
jgi:H+/Cl- antiporter ClcA